MLVAALFGSSAAAAAVSLSPEQNLFKRDPVPNMLPACSTYADLKWQPGKQPTIPTYQQSL